MTLREKIADDGSAGGEYSPSIDVDGPDAALTAMTAEVLRLSAELDDALTSLSKVIMALPSGTGMRLEGAVKGVMLLRAERDRFSTELSAMLAANQQLVAENERMAGSRADLAQVAIALLDQIAPLYREQAAQIAENYTEREHIAHSILQGVFPKQSDLRDAIAAAIRKGGMK
jgi:hypothetical protein